MEQACRGGGGGEGGRGGRRGSRVVGGHVVVVVVPVTMHAECQATVFFRSASVAHCRHLKVADQ